MNKLSQKSKSLLRALVNKRCEYILSKDKLSEREIYFAIKEFFKEYFQLDKEMTCQEIMDETHKSYLHPKMRDSINAFLKLVEKMEYNSNVFKETELKSLINKFRELVSELLSTKRAPPPRSKKKWHEKLIDKINKYKREDIIIEEYEQLKMNAAQGTEIIQSGKRKNLTAEEDHVRGDSGLSRHEMMMADLMKEIEDHIVARDAFMAQARYSEMKKYYDSLKKVQQKKFYRTLTKLYEDIVMLRKDLGMEGQKSALKEDNMESVQEKKVQESVDTGDAEGTGDDDTGYSYSDKTDDDEQNPEKAVEQLTEDENLEEDVEEAADDSTEPEDQDLEEAENLGKKKSKK